MVLNQKTELFVFQSLTVNVNQEKTPRKSQNDGQILIFKYLIQFILIEDLYPYLILFYWIILKLIIIILIFHLFSSCNYDLSTLIFKDFLQSNSVEKHDLYDQEDFQILLIIYKPFLINLKSFKRGEYNLIYNSV